MVNTKNVCIITVPIESSGLTQLNYLVNIIKPSVKYLFLITSNNFDKYSTIDKKYIYHIPYNNETSFFKIIWRQLFIQLHIIINILFLLKKCDLFILYIGGECLTLPILFLTLCRKKNIVMLIGDPLYTSKLKNDQMSRIIKLRKLNLMFNLIITNKVIIYSLNILKERNIKHINWKKIIVHRHYIESHNFFRNDVDQREYIIGYIGRFSEEKGIKNLLYSIPLVLEKNKNIKFKFIGDGDLKNYIENYLSEHKLLLNVEIKNWVQHDDIYKELSQFKLLVIPSFTEGLPNIMLEAMNCYTPVLATSVGAIPDILKHNINGFILKNNSPIEIQKGIVIAINNPNLLQITEASKEIIANKFSYVSIVKLWSRLINTYF